MFEQLFDLTPNLVLICSLNENGVPSQFIEVNRSACDRLGYSKVELLQRSLGELDALGDLQDSFRIRELLQDGQAKFECLFRTKGGVVFPVEVNCRKIESDGKLMVMAVVQDISERKEKEARLVALNDAFTGLGPDYSYNVQKLTAAAGEILRAECVFYQKLVSGNLDVVGQWHLPADYPQRKSCEGHMCTSIILASDGARIYDMADMPDACRFHRAIPGSQDPAKSFIGYPVYAFGHSLGLICATFSRSVVLDDEQRKVLDIIARAIGNEEERREYEELIKEREGIYRLLFDHAPDAIEVIDAEDVVVDCNLNHQTMTEQTYDEVVGKKLMQLVPETIHEVLKQQLNQIRRDGHGEWESVMQTASKRIFPVWRKASALKGMHGEYKGCVIINRDISERQRIQDALKASEAQYRLLVENSSDIVYSLSPTGQFTFINNAVRVLGFEPGEVIGTPMLKYIFEPDRERVTQTFLNAVQKGSLAPSTFRIRNKNGTLHHVEEIGNIQRDGAGQVTAVTGIVRDITERLKLEEARMKQERFKGVLETAGGTCHELNQPLQAILGYSDLLVKNATGNEGAAKWAGRIKEQVERMAVITKKLNSITRYATQDYINGVKIIDIDKASQA